MDASKAIWKASQTYAPTLPRRTTSATQMQGTRRSQTELVMALESCITSGQPGWYSVYSFPFGHPQDGNIPLVDCIFIDLDVTNRYYQPDEDKLNYDASMQAWRADMSALLARARMIANAIIDEGKAENFRVALSGHKGIHLYLDFSAISSEHGTIGEFKAGLGQYGQSVIEWLDSLAGGVNIQPWVDVDGSDLARLARHPNTVHHDAAYDDTIRWCVPVTVRELSELHCDGYLDYTNSPRWPDIERVPSQSAHERAKEHIQTTDSSRSASSGSAKKHQKAKTALSKYRDSEHVNEQLTVDDVLFFMKDKPCFKAFRNRDDAYSYGMESRTMELSIMGRLLDMGVPVAEIHAFFEPIPGYDKETTDSMLGDLLARGNEYGEFNCETICEDAERFCQGNSCSIYQRSADLQK
jgi:hypothetical protein